MKRLIKKYRQVLSRDAIVAVDNQGAEVKEKIGVAEQLLQKSLREINYYQRQVMDEVRERIKNSGTIALSDTEIVTKIFSGLKMYLDPRDLAITPHLALDFIWEHRITAAWLAVIRPNDVVMDIGANNGYYGALAAQKTYKQGSKVYMFEANPHLIPYVNKTIAVNFLGEQVVLENLAVADKSGKVTLHILKDYIGSSSVYSDDKVKEYMPNNWRVETAEAVDVPAVSIDGYCRDHAIGKVDLIIMDIEGFEDKAYAGMKQMIKASPSPTLFVEFTRRSYQDPKSFYNEMLKDFGNVYLLDDDGKFTMPKDTSYEGIIGDTEDWVMPIFSKKGKLADR